jgi:uncharacterized protein YbcI
MAGDDEHRGGGTLNAEISNAITRLLGEYTGRGPKNARTTVSGRLVVTLLEDTLTKGERSLVTRGHRDSVLRMRESFQQAMRDDAVSAIQELTGRAVVAFMSANHTDPDYAIECFVLDGDPLVTGAPRA